MPCKAQDGLGPLGEAEQLGAHQIVARLQGRCVLDVEMRAFPGQLLELCNALAGQGMAQQIGVERGGAE